MNSLMLTIHKYFTRLGVDEIRRRGAQDEKSLRMVKTLVHELCRYVVRLLAPFEHADAFLERLLISPKSADRELVYRRRVNPDLFRV